MLDNSIKRSKKQDCMLSIYPDNRCSWISPIHTGVSGWPQPSSAMRNFATEPATWYDLTVLQQTITNTDNASFFIDFDWHYDAAPAIDKAVLYRGVFGIYAYADGTIRAFTNMLVTQSIALRAAGNPLLRGRHTIFARVVGSIFYAQLDSEPEKSTTGTRWTTPPTYDPLITNADMYIYDAWARNDTTGKTVWLYPSFAERVRIVQQMPNVLTSNSIFEGAQSGVVRRVKTALDLRGNGTSKTFICRCYIPSHAADGKLYASGLATQGDHLGGTTSFVLRFAVWEDYRTGSTGKRLYIQYVGTSGALKGIMLDVASLSIFDRWITLAGVCDYSSGKVSAFLGGVKIGEATVAMEPFGQGAGSALSDAVSVMHDTLAANASGHKILYAQVYDGVLSENEIKSFSTYYTWGIPTTEGLASISTVGLSNLSWILPDGSKSSSTTLSETVDSGSILASYTNVTDTSSITISGTSTALQTSSFDCIGLPRVKGSLSISNVKLSGITNSIPTVSTDLILNDLIDLSGDAGNLPNNTNIKRVYNCSEISGHLHVVSTNLSVYYYGNTSVISADYDQTIQNIVIAGGTNGVLHIDENFTATGAGYLETLVSRGWAVTIIPNALKLSYPTVYGESVSADQTLICDDWSETTPIDYGTRN